jgi:hypothetical protein
MSIYDFKSSNIPGYGLGVDFGSMDTKGTLYGQQPITTAGRYAFTSNPDYIKASPEIQKLIAEKELENSSFNSIANMFKGFQPTLAQQEAQLKIAGDFQARQQAAAAPYNMAYGALNALSKLPDRISTDAANRAMLNVVGSEAAAKAFDRTMASYPQSRFQLTSPVQTQYFA